jgi:hypothetical protein
LKHVEAARLAIGIVRAHELFHFRFDVYALYNELILQKPLYNEYSQCVYRAVYCTADCFEETLANRSCRNLSARRSFEGSLALTQSAFLKEWLRLWSFGYGRALDGLCSGLGTAFEESLGTAIRPQSDWVYRTFIGALSEFLLPDTLETGGAAPPHPETLRLQ